MIFIYITHRTSIHSPRTGESVIKIKADRVLMMCTEIIKTLIRLVVSYGGEARTLTKKEEEALLILKGKYLEECMVLNMKWGMGVLDESRSRRDEQRRKYSKMDKRAKDKLVRSPGENRGGQDTQKDLHSRTERDEKKGKTQEMMERGSRKRSSSAG